VNSGLVPIKSPARAKQRLADAIDAAAHEELTRALLDDALALCAASDDVRWWVVSDDEGVRAEAQRHGFDVVADGGSGLNDAISVGLKVVSSEGADSVLVIPGDVPLAHSEDVDDILDTGAFSEVVVVPAADGGTNGLYFDLPTEFGPSFGDDSLRAHAETADRLSLRCTVLDLPRLSVDLDTPEDARRILEIGEGGGRTFEVLERLFR
jgi:2-phospho-L-lactate/phosphoenolpyruvate guanylyltransferase